MMGMFLAALDQTIVSTACDIVADLHDASHLAWSWSPICSPRPSRRRCGASSATSTAQALFSAAIIISWAARRCRTQSHDGELIAFRAIQGLGAAG